MHLPAIRVTTKERKFLSVAQAAELFGMSPMTLYRAINCGEFPAVKIRGRFVIPVQAIDAMVEAATSGQGLVDAADWAPGGRVA